MRVITGTAKGRRLKSVPGDQTRPVTDRAKTALFDIISYDIRGGHFLDLFAGTGQVGIEALSRGAASAVFVERHHAALRTIRENLAHTQLAENAHVIRADVFDFLAPNEENEEPVGAFDYVYVAPPQYQGLWLKTLRALDGSPAWLVDDGWAIVQINPREYEEAALTHLALFDQRTYGGVMFCFYSRLL